jgi:putative isomerase
MMTSFLLDEDHFNTFVPFPTLDAAHPNFDPLDGYWRGPVWLDQVWFACNGLRNYKMDSLADYFTIKTFENCDGMLGDGSFRENYHPRTGEGLNAEHFSWSAAHYLMLYWELGRAE